MLLLMILKLTITIVQNFPEEVKPPIPIYQPGRAVLRIAYKQGAQV